MKDIALFIKSYRPDLALVHRLLDSIAKHNREQISVFLSVPADDMPEFRRLARRFTDVSVLADDHFGVPRIDRKIWNLSPGYIAQQLVKLNVHRISEARNYLVLDSDTYFIRDFEAKDFVAPGGTGLTVLEEGKDLIADPAYATFAKSRTLKINAVADRMGMPTLSRTTCNGNAILQDSVLNEFHEWCRAEDLSLLDLMDIAPIEFTWYNFFLAKHCPERLVRIEPFIKVMHTRSEYRRLTAAGFSHESLRRSYLGVCINSGWAGTRQDRLVSRLERGSRTAELVIKSDRARNIAARELRLFLDAHPALSARRLIPHDQRIPS